MMESTEFLSANLLTRPTHTATGNLAMAQATGYAWGRQDEAGTGDDTATAIRFGSVWRTYTEGFHAERFTHMPTLRAAWEEFTESGHLFVDTYRGAWEIHPRTALWDEADILPVPSIGYRNTITSAGMIHDGTITFVTE